MLASGVSASLWVVIPFLLMAVLFGGLAGVAAAEAALASFGLHPWVHGLSWLRVHLIAIGLILETLFGLLPRLVASSGSPPPTRWDIWALLNGGLLLLLLGVPPLHSPAIALGGMLVMASTALLLHQLVGLRTGAPLFDFASGRPFYLTGLAYLLVGALLGTGIWVGWSGPLSLPSPKETHVHANLWGFLALIFAGLLIDLYQGLTGRPLARPAALRWIFRLMAAGALGLVVGPWAQWHPVTAVGLVVHAVGTGWLLISALPRRRAAEGWTPALAQLLGAYVWFFVPVLAGPMVVLNAAGYLPASRFASAELEGNGAPILIYGWALQFALVVGPALFSRAFFPAERPRAGGHWGSMLSAHTGVVCYAAGLFATSARPGLHGAAYLLWIMAAAPSARLTWNFTRTGFARLDPHRFPHQGGPGS